MDSEKIMVFVQEHWDIILIVTGAVLIVGAAMNWNWLCDPTSAPQTHRYGRSARRVNFFAGRGAGGRRRLEHGTGGALTR